MVAFLLKDICFYFTKGINAFWNTKYRDKKNCVILLIIFSAASMISREKYSFCMLAIYLFLFAGVGCVYDNWLTDIFCKKEKSGKLLLKIFSHKYNFLPFASNNR
jgi:hypothetical protein